jgi:hypothetical protein
VATSAIQEEKEALEGAPNYSGLDVVEALPLSRYYPEGGEELLCGMAGATIMRIGSTGEEGIEGGGLIIDYRPSGSMALKRVVFAFNESGLWLEWEGALDPSNQA